MKYCPHCRRRIPDHFKECPFDLTPLAPWPAENRTPPAPSPPTGREAVPEIRVPTFSPKPFTPAPGISLAAARTPSDSGWLWRIAGAFLFLLLMGGVSFSAVFLVVYFRPKHTLISVKSEPAGAWVYLDETRLGTTPMEGKVVPLGVHRLRINKRGFFEASRVLHLREGLEERIKETLEPVSGRVLTREETRQIEDWTRQAERTLEEKIYFPPPAEYNTATLCRRILETDPENGFALETLKKLTDQTREAAEAAFQKANWREAEKHYAGLLLLAPEDTSIQYRLEELRAGIQKSEEQRRSSIQALAQRTDEALAADRLAPPAEGNAYDLIRQLQRLDPRSEFAAGARARLAERARELSRKLSAEARWADAQRILYYAAQLSPEDAELKAQLETAQKGAAGARQASDERARQAELQRQQELRRQELQRSVRSAFQEGRYEQAIEDMLQLEKLSALDEEMVFLLGSALQRTRQYRRALQAFESCVALNPKRAEAYLQMALICQSALKDPDRAEKYFRRLLSLGGSGEYDPPRIQRLLQDMQQQAMMAQRLSQPLETEHRHAIGSCQGRIIWGGVTMQYWSSEKSHSFLRPYSQIRKVERRPDSVEIQFPDKKFTFRFKNPEDVKWVVDWLSEKRNPGRGNP